MDNELPRLIPTGTCWCGCGAQVGLGSFFARGHDKTAEAALLAVEYGSSVAQLLHKHGYGPGHPISNAAVDKGHWSKCPHCEYVGAPASIRNHLTKVKRAEATQKEALEQLLGHGGMWDPQRAVTALGDAGHQVDEKRARQILRDLADAGLLVKTQDRPVQYHATEKRGPRP